MHVRMHEFICVSMHTCIYVHKCVNKYICIFFEDSSVLKGLTEAKVCYVVREPLAMPRYYLGMRVT